MTAGAHTNKVFHSLLKNKKNYQLTTTGVQQIGMQLTII